MAKITFRRVISLVIAAALFAGLYYWVQIVETQLGSVSELTGWALLSLMLLLTLFNLRKKLSFLPLMSAYTWAQLHIYGGLLLVGVLALHQSSFLPNGLLEITLSTLLVIEVASGLFGLYISRSYPKTLRLHSENAIYERLPALRREIAMEVERLVNSAIDQHGSAVLKEFYHSQLFVYLSQASHSWRHILGTQSVEKSWQKVFSKVRSQLNSEEAEILAEIELLVQQKVGLDLQYARRRLLKYWLFLHIPLSYGLLLLALLHVTLVYAYAGI